MVSLNEKSAPLLLMMLAAMSSIGISHAFVAQPSSDFGRSIQLQQQQQQQQTNLKLGFGFGNVYNRNISPALFMSSSFDADTDADTDTDGMPIDTKQDDDFAPSDVDDNDNPAGSSSSNQKANAYSNTNAAQFDIKPNGLGEWEEMHGNYILRPPAMDQEPRALIHFLGGAIVGAAPDISYRYMLERLAQKGFLIVATPFTLSFDYISTCDDIIGRFERIAPTLARQFGPVPVVGVGHSCGALLQLLITTLFPDTPRAANALISYNNKEVKDAIPLFDELFAPLFVSLATNETNPLNELIGGASDGAIFPPNSVELMNIGIQLSRKAVRGELPSDDLLTDIAKRTTPKPLASILPQDIVVPSILRDSFRNLFDPVKDAKAYAGIIPLLDQSLDVLEQIPSLIEEVAEGARDFNPNPASVKAAARRSYRARRTLVIQYDNDPLDESEEVESLLREAETVMRSKRPDVDVDVQRTVLKGGHATPCLAPPLDLASKAEDILGEDTAKDKLLYIGADATVDELVRWLEEGNL